MTQRGRKPTDCNQLSARLGIGLLAKTFTPELVDRVVDRCGVREQRRRALPSELVVYYTLAMVLFPNSSYSEVWDKLIAGFEWVGWPRPFALPDVKPTPAAITYARQRLGWVVMKALLAETVRLPNGEGQRGLLPGMRLVAVSGVGLSLPKTVENAPELGYLDCGTANGLASQVQVVAAVECVTGAILAAELSSPVMEEQSLVRQLLVKLSPGDMLLTDSRVLSQNLLCEILAAGVHVLVGTRIHAGVPVLEVLGDGTYRSLFIGPEWSRETVLSSTGIAGVPVRVLEDAVTCEGCRTSERTALFTDILDPQVLTIEEALAYYASRRNLKSCFCKLEASPNGHSTVMLRSMSARLILQEIYAMLCCYQAIRTLISCPAVESRLHA